MEIVDTKCAIRNGEIKVKISHEAYLTIAEYNARREMVFEQINSIENQLDNK